MGYPDFKAYIQDKHSYLFSDRFKSSCLRSFKAQSNYYSKKQPTHPYERNNKTAKGRMIHCYFDYSYSL